MKIVRQAGLAVMKEDVGDGIIIGVLVNLMSQIQSYDGYAQPAKKRMKYSDILADTQSVTYYLNIITQFATFISHSTITHISTILQHFQ